MHFHARAWCISGKTWLNKEKLVLWTCNRKFHPHSSAIQFALFCAVQYAHITFYNEYVSADFDFSMPFCGDAILKVLSFATHFLL